MHQSKATKALCAVLAIALIACPFVATAARVTPQRSLLGSDKKAIGYIPVWRSAPSFAPSCVSGEECLTGELLGLVPILQSAGGLLGLGTVTELGNLISLRDGLPGIPIPDGTTLLPAAFGKAVSVVNVVLGPLRPIFGGSVVGGVVGLVTGLLATVLGLVAVVLGAVVALVDGLLIALFGGAVRIGGILPLTSSGLLGGLLGGPLAGIPFFTALSSAGPVPAILKPQVLGALFKQDGSLVNLDVDVIFPKGLFIGGILGNGIPGLHPVYINPAPLVDVDISLNVLGLISVCADVTVGPGIKVGAVVDISNLGEAVGYIVTVGKQVLKA